MSRIDTASLERIKADFEKSIPGVPALYHVLIVGAAGPVDPTHLQRIVPGCVNIVGHHEGDFLNDDPPSWCRGYFFTMRATDAGPELMRRFDDLADTILKVAGFANAPPSAWLFGVYRTAWSGDGGAALRADKFRVFATPNSPIDHCHFVPINEPPPEGMQLLFPHEYCCILKPNVFTASAKAIEAMVAEVRVSNVGIDSDIEHQVANQLRQPISIQFDATPLITVIGHMRKVTGLNIYTDWQAMEAAGVVQDTPITLQLRDIPTSQALRLILQQASAGSDLCPIKSSIIEGVVTISTQRDLARTTLTRTYNITDLLCPSGLINPDEILELMHGTVGAPDDWECLGGDVSAAFVRGGALIVKTNWDNHRTIADLLTGLRNTATAQARRESGPVQDIRNLPAPVEANTIDPTIVRASPKSDLNNEKVGVAGEGMTWEIAKNAAEQYCKRNPFPGVNALAKLVECSPSTMSKAINRSLRLKALRAEYKRNRRRPRTQQLNDEIMSNTHQTTERDEQLSSLINEQKAEQRRDEIVPRKRSR